MLKKTQRFRGLLATNKIIVAPAAYDALSAKIIEKTGFDAVWVSGASLTNALLGSADVGMISYGEVRNSLHYINSATNLPVMVDVDTGYGGILNTYRMVEEFQALGIAGIQIEDQTYPKRCAYFSGLSVVSVAEMEGRINAVLKAKTDKDFLVIARTDSGKCLGFDEAISRAKHYWEMGADMIFISAPSNLDEFYKMAELKIPICTAVVEGTSTENFSVEELGNMGFKIVKYPQTLIRATIRSITDVLTNLKKSGKADLSMIATTEQRNLMTDLEKYNILEMELKM